ASLLFIAGFNALFLRFGLDFGNDLNIDLIFKYSKSVYILIVFTLISNILNGVYKIVWRYATPKDVLVLLRGLFLGYIFTLAFLHFTRIAILPRSVGMLTFFGSYFLLLSSRMIYQTIINWKKKSGRLIGIVGAGDAGVILLNEIRRNNYGTVVAFFDDDKQKIGRYISGVKVVSNTDYINQYVEKFGIEEIIIAIPSASKEVMDRILSHIDTTKTILKIFPSINQLLDRPPNIKDLREVSIQDLLGREQIKVDISSISKYLTDKTIIITGAGGSIGSEIARQVCQYSPRKVILLGRGENSIYEILSELKEKFYEIEIFPVIADISDEKLMEKIFNDTKPQIVFHAAAHKHVYFMQYNLYEAIRVNLKGTINLAKLSCKYNVERFVFISTDKAVNPTSFMGASKRLAELYLLSNVENCSTHFSIVRFGNVIGSRGSVLWKFKKQIEKGGPITITDPRMKRYWMSIPEAVSLVIQAGALADNLNSDRKKVLYVLDMGEQVYVEKVAKTLAQLMGKPNIEVKYTGAVAGEKLEEELFYEFEKPEKTIHPKIYEVNYYKSKFPNISIEDYANKIMDLYSKGDEKSAEELLDELIKTYNKTFSEN
ncbi:MAG: SDR family NAD(P)-dependent oxidoreductase, partial [Fervidobacterium sp.]